MAIRRARRSVDTSRPHLRPLASSELEVDDAAVMLVALQPVSVAADLERSGERGSFVRRTGPAPHLAAWGPVMDHAAAFLDRPDAVTPAATEEPHDLLC